MTSTADLRVQPANYGRGLEAVFLVLAFFVISDAASIAFYGLRGAAEKSLTGSNSTRLVTMLAIYAIAAGAMAFRNLRMFGVFLNNPLLLAIALYPLASILWASEPDLVFRRAAAHALTITFVAYLVMNVPGERVLRSFAIACAIGGVGSLLLIGAIPGAGVEHSGPNAGSWHGLYGHKAQVARVAAIAFICAAAIPVRSHNDRVLKWIVIASLAPVLVMSQSRAGWIMVFAGLATWALLVVMRRMNLTPLLRALLIVGAVAAAVTCILLAEAALLALMGRDERMSGRVSLWRPIFASFQDHPWLGVGYRSFWTPDGLNDFLPLLAHRGFIPGHGHNGYLDTVAELGLVGVALLAAFLVSGFVVGLIESFRRRGNPLAPVCVSCLTVFAINNYVATVAFEHSDILWVFAVWSWGTLMVGLRAPARQPARSHGLDGDVRRARGVANAMRAYEARPRR
ncbi:MAG: O-antigen ligase family protein [Hyphomonadaceae bacterium]|nr:O-antigen ligase family protein [Hyphomonadaceae bacterium]